jgi:hypothetical protein
MTDIEDVIQFLKTGAGKITEHTEAIEEIRQNAVRMLKRCDLPADLKKEVEEHIGSSSIFMENDGMEGFSQNFDLLANTLRGSSWKGVACKK